MGQTHVFSYFYKVKGETYHSREQVNYALKVLCKTMKRKPKVIKFETYFSNGRTSKRVIEVKGKKASSWHI